MLEGVNYYRSNSTNVKGAPPVNGKQAERIVPGDGEESIKIDLKPKQYSYVYAVNTADTSQQFDITYSGTAYLSAMGALVLLSISML